MDDSFPNSLPLWRGRSTTSLAESLPAPSAPPLPPHSLFLAEKIYAEESLFPTGRVPRLEPGAEPYTLQWFLEIEHNRHQRFGRWMPRVLEFAKHSGDTLLGLDGSIGTDWVAYARHGAHVLACDSSTDLLALTRRNFELRGLTASYLHADATALPLETSSIDVACVGGLLNRLTEPQPVVRELYRVLKPGGKVIAIAPAKYDMHFWSSFWFPWQRWLGWQRADNTPIRYSGRELIRLFQQFSEHRISKRHLRKSETPHLWRWLPPIVLERIAGRFLIVKTFKPLSAAMSVPLAA
jgi:ubiquinone/menaquinone biosynthesis C-methylase UbiE